MVKLRTNIVREYIVKHNMTNQQFGALLGASPAFFSQLLNHTRYPGPVLRKKIMKVMGIKDWNILFEMVEG
jgi:predicted transcriptional regulator